MKGILGEFKKFAMRGNVMDMAVGIIIGAAFGKIVDSLVKDIIMPPLGILLGKVDFANLFFVLKDGPKVPAPYESLEVAKNAGAITINAGAFLNTIISFLIQLSLQCIHRFNQHKHSKSNNNKADNCI